MSERLRWKWKCNTIPERPALREGGKNMSEERELKKGNGQKPDKESKEDVEGYAYCATNKQRCLNDCGGNGNATPFLSDLN